MMAIRLYSILVFHEWMPQRPSGYTPFWYLMTECPRDNGHQTILHSGISRMNAWEIMDIRLYPILVSHDSFLVSHDWMPKRWWTSGYTPFWCLMIESLRDGGYQVMFDPDTSWLNASELMDIKSYSILVSDD